MKFKDILTENKERKPLRAVEKQQRKGKTDRKWRGDEETGGSYTRTQNWDTSTSDLLLLIKFRKLSTFKML